MRKFPFLTAVLCAGAMLVGCQRTRDGASVAEKAPEHLRAIFAATLWDGRSVEGPLAWEGDGRIRIGDKVFDRSQVRSIVAAEAGYSEAAVEPADLPEGYRPLSSEELAAYRERAGEAAERWEGSDAVFCLDKGENILRGDGSSVYRYHALFLVLKEAARSHADITLGFSDGRSRSRVLFARVVRPDGQSQWAPESAFTESVPAQDRQFFDKRRRILSGRVPGAEVGAFVEYAYEYEDYNPEIKDFFFPGYFFQQDFPVLDSVIDIYVPAGRPLNYVALNTGDEIREPKLLAREGCDGYRWAMHDVPPVTAEPFMPPQRDVVPSVHASLYFDWAKFMQPTGEFQAERIAVTPLIQTLADELTAGKQSDDEKVAAIYHWIQRNINYLSIKASLSSGWAGHPAEETLENGYGDCTDVSNLASSLCRAVGIDAYPAVLLTNDSGTAVTEIPNPDANHAIALVYPDGQARFIDPTTTDYRYPYLRADNHGAKAVIYIKGEIIDIPVPPPADNLRESVQSIVLNPDGSAQIVEKNLYNGPYEAGVRSYWRSVPPEYHPQVMQQYLQSRVPGAVLSGFDLGGLESLDTQLGMTIEYTLPVAGTSVRDLFIFGLPGFELRFPEASLAEREYDVVMTTTQSYRTRAEITIPEGFEFAGAPEALEVNSAHLTFQGLVEPSPDGRSIEVRMLYERLVRVVPVDDYAEYRANAAAIRGWTDLKIVLRKAPEEHLEEDAS